MSEIGWKLWERYNLVFVNVYDPELARMCGNNFDLPPIDWRAMHEAITFMRGKYWELLK
jgi:hypothetical protein